MNRRLQWSLCAAAAVIIGLGGWFWTRPERPWTLDRIQLSQTATLAPAVPVTVAILDTGRSEQPRLVGIQHSGYDFVSNAVIAGDGSGRDPFPLASRTATGGHGTAVAGLIHSVDPWAALVHVRVIGRARTATLQDALDGLCWAAGLEVAGTPPNRFPARVINASFHLEDVPRTGCAPAMQRAINEVTARGAVVVASAGNTGGQAALNTPAGCRHVITVAATDETNRPAPYSNWGRAVTLAAPGGTAAEPIDVLRGGGGETEQSGTSFAAALVSGAVSLLLSQHPALSPSAVKAVLEQSAQPFPGGSVVLANGPRYGSGLLNVSAALAAVRKDASGLAPTR